MTSASGKLVFSDFLNLFLLNQQYDLGVLIKALQQRKFENRTLGVDLVNPDFALFARAFGVRHWEVRSTEAFEAALGEALASKRPALVEVRL